jgi:hypothetical protein
VSLVAMIRRFLGGREQGQATLEFVLLLPLFIGFLFLTIDFGLVMYHWVSAANAAREGARYGAVGCGAPGGAPGNCTEAAIKDWASIRSGGVLPPDSISVRWKDHGAPLNGVIDDKGDSVIVRVNHSYQFTFAPLTFPVVSCADMRLERVDSHAGGKVASGDCP